jgi:CRISPR-associated protein Csm2
MSKLELDFSKDVELLNKTAQIYAKKISDGVTSTQVRKFFDKVLVLNEKAKYVDDFQSEILPFVKSLNSKVAYANARKVVNNAFVTMINECVQQINSKEKLEIFCLFFEAVIGFHKSIEEKNKKAKS